MYRPSAMQRIKRLAIIYILIELWSAVVTINVLKWASVAA